MGIFWGKFLGLRLESAGFHFHKFKKTFFLIKYKKCFNVRVGKFHFPKYKEFFSGWIFFFEFGLKSSLGSPIIYYYSNVNAQIKVLANI